jgi:hypothetical protein
MTLRDADPAIPAVQNRPADNWRALIAIADAAGGWGRVRACGQGPHGTKNDDDKGDDPATSAACSGFGQEWLGAEMQRLIELPETPWAEWNRAKADHIARRCQITF